MRAHLTLAWDVAIALALDGLDALSGTVVVQRAASALCLVVGHDAYYWQHERCHRCGLPFFSPWGER